MPKIKYSDLAMRPAALATIATANDIIAEYAAAGLDLTLRQLYYQFVARTLIANNEREYKKLGDTIANGRMAGLIDWEAIVDRTRFVRTQSHWDTPADIISSCAGQFKTNKWANQDVYCEVWIEKDALIGVIEGVCLENDVPYLACRGYASASEVWRAGHGRLRDACRNGKDCTVFYLGDHDPSGIDMTRDVEDRLNLFVGSRFSVKVQRLALNMVQVEEHNPPPNPTKLTDSRATKYIESYGMECWELDALDPILIRDLVGGAIESVRDDAQWEEDIESEMRSRKQLAAVARNWDDVTARLEEEDDGT